jgi:hypothetical protein
MSFEPTPPQDPRRDIPQYDAEIVDLNFNDDPQPTPKLPYKAKGFKDVYEEAKWLRKLSGNTAIAFMLIFLALLSAGSYANFVEFRRSNSEVFSALADSIAAMPVTNGEQDSASKVMMAEVAKSFKSTSEPTFFELFGLRLLSALGSIGFFVFAGAAVAEISFRAYENRDIEPYEVLDTLTKSHGINLLQLGLYFLVLLLCVGVITILSTAKGADPGLGLLSILLLFVQLYLQLRTMFSVQSMIGEGLSAREAVVRSWQLTRGNVMRLVWWTIVFSVFFFITAFFFYLLPIFFGVVLISAIFSFAGEVVGVIAGLVALALMVKHFSLIFFFQMALYRELRLRLDGEDPVEISPAIAPALSTP